MAILTRGDYGFDLTFKVQQANKQPANITGKTMTFKMMNDRTGAVKVNGTCVVTDGLGGVCKYAVQDGDLDTVGTYHAELTVSSAGSVQTATLESIEVVSDLP
jgi:hypothetical protein